MLRIDIGAAVASMTYCDVVAYWWFPERLARNSNWQMRCVGLQLILATTNGCSRIDLFVHRQILNLVYVNVVQRQCQHTIQRWKRLEINYVEDCEWCLSERRRWFCNLGEPFIPWITIEFDGVALVRNAEELDKIFGNKPYARVEQSDDVMSTKLTMSN